MLPVKNVISFKLSGHVTYSRDISGAKCCAMGKLCWHFLIFAFHTFYSVVQVYQLYFIQLFHVFLDNLHFERNSYLEASKVFS